MSSRLRGLPFLLFMAAAPAAAQTDSTRFERFWIGEYDGPRRIELGVTAGYALSTDWTDLVALHLSDARGGMHRQVLLRNVAVAPGAGGGAALTYWRGRHGFRVSGGYSSSCLTTSSRCGRATALPGGNAALAIAEVPLDIWRYGVEGIVGLRNWNDSRVWRPFVVVGIGGVAYDPDADALPLFPGSFETVIPPGAAPGSIIISNGGSTLLVATDELGLEHVFGLTLGLGMDLRVPIGIGGVSLRLEAADQITSSPFSVRVTRLDGDGGWRDRSGADETVFRSAAIHNLRLTAGLSIELGLNGPRTERDPWSTIRGR